MVAYLQIQNKTHWKLSTCREHFIFSLSNTLQDRLKWFSNHISMLATNITTITFSGTGYSKCLLLQSSALESKEPSFMFCFPLYLCFLVCFLAICCSWFPSSFCCASPFTCISFIPSSGGTLTQSQKIAMCMVNKQSYAQKPQQYGDPQVSC